MLDDGDLFRAIEQDGGPETLRLWESERPTVVVGALGNIRRQVYEETCIADRVPIHRRISGGGAVVVGPGCLNYSLLFSLEKRPELRHVERSYEIILGKLVEALKQPGLEIRGTSDIVLGDRKISGNAQRRGRRALLHHGTFLYDFDVQLMERYLKPPERQPAYRSSRTHHQFVTNLRMTADAIKEAIVQTWGDRPVVKRSRSDVPN